MMQRTCFICGTADVEYSLVQEYPVQMMVRASELGLTPEEHAAKNLPHVSYNVVKFFNHTGKCGLLCAGSYTSGERIFVSQFLHDNTNCSCACKTCQGK